jgi:NADH:ubiquinone oxidoreductase subunit C
MVSDMDLEILLKEIDPSMRIGKDAFWLNIESVRINEVLKKIKDAGVYHISTIVGVDIGEEIEIIYHLVYETRKINVRTRVPKAKPEIQTITGIYAGSDLFERELMEMLGVIVKGHPNPKRLFLAIDSPENPLRKAKSPEPD